jgi:DNA invertase Pin-like site-specific DNA recombinase
MSKSKSSNTLHIYTRVSTMAQADHGTSLQSQLELGIKKAKDLGFEFQHWDEGGKSSHHEDIADRPVLFDLYRYIKTGIVKHLWIYDQSRLSRNDQVASVFRYECNKQGVTLYTKDGQFDLSSPQDKFLKQLLDAVAEFDNTTRTERTRLGKLHRVRSGSWHGGPPPFGYRLEDKKLVINESEAVWVRQVFKRSLAGAVSPDLKLFLDSNSVSARRGGLWTLGSIQALLRNRHYTGQYVYTDGKTDAKITVQCPQIVDMVTWEGVQIAHKREGNRHEQKNRTTKNFYLLRDIMFCGHCARPISGRVVANNYEALYYCPNKERTWAEKGGTDTPWVRGTGCGFERSMNIHRADELVWKYVTELHQKSSLLKEEVKRRVMAAQGLGLVSDSAARKKAEARARRLQKELQNVNDVLGSLEASRLLKRVDASHGTTVERITDEKDRIEAALNDVRLELRGENERQKWVNWLEAFGAELDQTREFTDEQRQQYIAGLVERIDVTYTPEKSEHQLTLQFKLPIVGDSIKWKKQSKNAGYEVLDGAQTAVVTVKKKSDNSDIEKTPTNEITP